MRTVTKIAIAVAALAVFAVAVWFALDYFKAPQLGPETPADGSGLPILPADQGGGIPPVGDTGAPDVPDIGGVQPPFSPKRFSDTQAFFAWASASMGDVLYITPVGTIFSAREGPDLEVSTQSFTALNRVEPSVDGNRLLAAFGDPRNPDWRVFDTLDRAWHPLQPGIVSASWGGQSDIFVLIRGEHGTALQRIDISRSPHVATTLIADFRLTDVTLLSLSSTTLLIAQRPSALVKGTVWQFDTRTSLLAAVLPQAAGRTVGATQDRSILFSFSAPDQFTIVDRSFQELVPVPFWTLPMKCGGNASVVYCFAPSSLPAKPVPVIPDDYLSKRLHTIDDLYRIDLGTGTIESVFTARDSESSPLIDGASAIVSEGSIYFINAADGNLYWSALP
jgi:hypothetical protein